MFLLRTLPAMAIGMFIAQTMPAQGHYNAWFRSTLSIPAGSKIKVDAEIQHRRQNGIGDNNLFNRNLMYSFRSWVHYQSSKNVKFSVSPFACFYNYKIIQKPSDEKAAPHSEVRFSAAADIQQALYKKLFFVNRTAVEYRVPESSSNITRLRTRLALRYDFNQVLNMAVYDEVLLNLSGTNSNHFFDHNRTGINLGCKIATDVKFDIGYLYSIRLPLSGVSTLQEHILIVNITVQLQ